MTSRYSTDIVIFGGGIAGLWLLNRLQSDGFHAILFETRALGSGQTLASQGIIHGGLKYALSGSVSGAANVIADMPQRWRQCLSGSGELDLRDVAVLSDQYYMWSDGSLRSKLKTFLGSKSLVGRVEALDQNNYPTFFQDNSVDGTLYQLPDFVVDTPSLLQKLRDPVQSRIFQIDDGAYQFKKDEVSSNYRIELSKNETEIEFSANKIIFCAGEGNAELIEQASIKTISAQVRPLHMVYLKKPNLPQLFVHCIGDDFSLTPKLTVTSHTDLQGQTVWYLGGDLAEQGVSKSKADQIEAAQQLVKKLFPWIDISATEWNSFLINRAEANINNNYRPDDAYVATEGNIILAWPTKLTLTPSLADKVINALQSDSVTPAGDSESLQVLSEFRVEPDLANAYWD
ncbi:MAG: FAD-dependent oxidoreductase [Pseudomonadales bacterium]|nr:FAD-dependent oxidoreductase [Pseudomonadales bacterium]